MLKCIADACELSPARDRGTICIESDCGPGNFAAAFDELNALEARQYAQSVASANGVTSPRINGNVIGPYPVNAEGIPLDKVAGPDGKKLPAAHPSMQPNRYRIDVPVASPLL